MKAGWRVVPLGEIAAISYGYTAKASPEPIGPKFLRITDIQDNSVNWSTVPFCSIDSAERRRHAIKDGDIVFARTGATTGKSFLIKSPPDAVCASYLIKLRVEGRWDILPEYLSAFFQTTQYWKAIELGTEGAAQGGFNASKLAALPIPLPPLDEQKRIVAVLDEAFEGLSRARANAEANLADARELLDNETDKLLLDGNSRWKTCVLEDVISRFEYGTSTKSQRSGSAPVLRMGNLQNGEVDWSDLVYTNETSEIQRLSLRDGDVLFNRTNSLEHVGKTAIFRGNRRAIFAGYLVRLHCNAETLDPEFLTLFLNCRPTREHGRSISGKSVNQANISAGKLKTYPIKVPPLQEQKEIATRILDLRQAVGATIEATTGKLRGFDTLRQSLLQKAFSGELT